MEPETSDSFLLRIVPASTGWRVTVLTLDHHGVATTIENSQYAAAVVGIDLFHRWQASR